MTCSYLWALLALQYQQYSFEKWGKNTSALVRQYQYHRSNIQIIDRISNRCHIAIKTANMYFLCLGVFRHVLFPAILDCPHMCLQHIHDMGILDKSYKVSVFGHHFFNCYWLSHFCPTCGVLHINFWLLVQKRLASTRVLAITDHYLFSQSWHLSWQLQYLRCLCCCPIAAKNSWWKLLFALS